jgi:phage terminase large subunit GpA-like protein
MGLWFDAIDSGRWRRRFHTGPSQGGKTLQGSTVPLMWHLFEWGEDVIYGVPSLDMVSDKWNDDILPAIEACRYKDLLPSAGRGSKGGTPTRIQFANGAGLRFMTAGGNDKTRAGKTGRVLVVTEADGFDVVGGESREADKFSQLEARLNAHGDNGILYAECTLSTESGRTHREIKGGTDSRILIRCQHCRKFVTPEREHLVGWRDAPDDLTAADLSVTVCPACGATWAEDQRCEANRDCRLLHSGQELAADGETIVGNPKRTNTLGFRWTAANNLLVTQGKVGSEEWRASRDPDEESGEKKMRQFFWALPHMESKTAVAALDAGKVEMRLGEWNRGIVPPDTICITIGIDIGVVSRCHWTAIAWRPNGTPHVLEYEVLDVQSESMSSEQAIMSALREFRDTVVRVGWTLGERTLLPQIVLVDSGNWTDTIYGFCVESGLPFYPAKGFGAKQAGRQKDFTGTSWKSVVLPSGIQLIDINADEAKGYVHQRLKTPLGMPGAMTFFRPSQGSDHRTFAHHLLSEREVEEFIAGRGLVKKYEQIRRQNHFLDSTALAAMGGVIVGQRVVTPELQPVAAAPEPETETKQANSPAFKWRGRY